mgnify:CR=1 FL=1
MPTPDPGRRGPRARTQRPRPLTKEERAEWGSEMAAVPHERPRTRADCVNGLRPCPFVACEYHLYLDVNHRNGHIKFNFPNLEVWELTETCALDVASHPGNTTLEEIAAVMNMTRERVRQIEEHGLAAAKASKIGVKLATEQAAGLLDLEFKEPLSRYPDSLFTTRTGPGSRWDRPLSERVVLTDPDDPDDESDDEPTGEDADSEPELDTDPASDPGTDHEEKTMADSADPDPPHEWPTCPLDSCGHAPVMPASHGGRYGPAGRATLACEAHTTDPAAYQRVWLAAKKRRTGHVTPPDMWQPLPGGPKPRAELKPVPPTAAPVIMPTGAERAAAERRPPWAAEAPAPAPAPPDEQESDADILVKLAAKLDVDSVNPARLPAWLVKACALFWAKA